MTAPTPANTRQRILDAAIRVFARKGYHETRMDDIVAEAHVSKGGVYFHFPGKERLFLAIIDQFAGLLEKRLTEAIAAERGGVRRVTAALEAGLDTFAEYRPLAKIFLVQAVGLGERFERKRLEINDRFASLIRTYLEQAVAEGDIPPLDAEVTAYAWVGAIYELVTRWLLTGKPAPDRWLPSLRLMLLRSIGLEEET
ncbi:MAG TPA: TetR/AcrR family transcriptional regulator [Chloroflexi bacterium]|nr:TetR/AcrR family transcriptional regulator [Chloroflexota bacterium]